MELLSQISPLSRLMRKLRSKNIGNASRHNPSKQATHNNDQPSSHHFPTMMRMYCIRSNGWTWLRPPVRSQWW